ncbi:kinase-like domain-containing protein, partial [Roridomyces roridus]
YRTGKTLKTYSVNGVIWATLKEAVHTRSGKQYACKIIRKEDMHGREHLVHNEVAALQRIQSASPNVLKMRRYVETAHDVRLYLDLCAGGSLSERIAISGAYSEVKAADLIRTLLRAVKHVHDSGVVHRDLRPENILFHTPDESAPIVITEFGLSRLVEEAPYKDHDNIQLYASGSWSYMAPEILANAGGHGAGVDVWQIGILTFFILTGGYNPFDRDTLELQRHAILTGEYRIPSNGKWESLSANARQFIGSCLAIDPNRRPTVEEILSHAVRYSVSISCAC